jgi:hypothetical protein
VEGAYNTIRKGAELHGFNGKLFRELSEEEVMRLINLRISVNDIILELMFAEGVDESLVNKAAELTDTHLWTLIFQMFRTVHQLRQGDTHETDDTPRTD